MNAVDVILVILLAAVVGLSLRKMIKTRRNGGCGCGCSGCSNTTCAARKNTNRN